jgi:hypothetical protein
LATGIALIPPLLRMQDDAQRHHSQHAMMGQSHPVAAFQVVEPQFPFHPLARLFAHHGSQKNPLALAWQEVVRLLNESRYLITADSTLGATFTIQVPGAD